MGGKSTTFTSPERMDSRVERTERPHPLKWGRIRECWKRIRRGSMDRSCSVDLDELVFFFGLAILMEVQVMCWGLVGGRFAVLAGNQPPLPLLPLF